MSFSPKSRKWSRNKKCEERGLTSLVALFAALLLTALFPGCGENEGKSLPPRDADAYHEAAADIISFQNDDEITLTLDGICKDIPHDAEEVSVELVNDGDTITLTDGRLVRYTGIDAPEPHHDTGEPEPYSTEALEYNRNLLEGRTVLLVFDKERTDRYGRVLAYVFARPKAGEGKTVFVNAEMVLAGYAPAKRFPLNVKHAGVLSALEEYAALHKRGMWKTTPHGYVGSRASRKFHRLDCPYGKQILPRNRIEFKTRREAFEAGYVPCRSCKP